MNKDEDLIALILSTLSFYEPMTLEKIILDLDSESLSRYPQFGRDHLEEILGQLVRQKSIKMKKIEGDRTWIRLFPNKSLWQKWKSLF